MHPSRFLLLAIILLACTACAERKLLSDQHFAPWIDNHIDELSSNTSMHSLSRMLLAFQALDKLGDKKVFRRQRKDNPSASKNNRVKLTEAVLGVATGEIGVESLSENAADALSQYLNKLIEKEQALLAEYGQGTLQEQFSYVVDLPERRVQQRLLPMFGLVNSGTLVNTTQALRENFCSPTMALPRRYTGNRAVINGPAFEMTLSSGKCEVGAKDNLLPFTFLMERDVSCSGHHVSWTKTPMSISRREVLPEAFAAEQCRVEREFGTDYEKVLYGGGPLLHFATVDDFVDAVVTKKYSFFDGIEMGSVVKPGGNLPPRRFGEFGKVKNGREVLDLDRLGRERFDKDWAALSRKFSSEKGAFRVLEKNEFGFWSAMGPGRLLKNKKEFKKNKLSRIRLANLRDIDITSPLSSLAEFTQ